MCGLMLQCLVLVSNGTMLVHSLYLQLAEG